MKHKIRLREGEALVVVMPFIHSGRGPMIHDG